MKIIDISQEVLGCKVYPGDPKPKTDEISRIDKGGLYNLSAFSMCAHNGTHIDAPFHFINEGKKVDEISLDAFVGVCFVAEHEGDILIADAYKIMEKATNADAKERVLIKGNAVVTEEAARVFALSGIKLLGNESQTVGPESGPMEVHKILLEKDIVLLEGINLASVYEGQYFLSAAPLNLKGFDGSPCRAYLIKG